MAKNLPTRMEEYPPRYCPECGPKAGYMDVLLFMGVQADGTFRRVAQVIA